MGGHASSHPTTDPQKPPLRINASPSVTTAAFIAGWRKVADTALAFTQRFARLQPA
jgi:hypothetical protein